MAIIKAHKLGFRYEHAPHPVLSDLSFTLEKGAFCLVCGPTGSGKTTLLKTLKPELHPSGFYEGSLRVYEKSYLNEGNYIQPASTSDAAPCSAFVFQDPDAQILCDTVLAEVAFGLENIGFDENKMRRRVAEVSHYLGMTPWMDRRCEELSGGQKQLLNLASALVMRPDLLLLDEPLAQLDPAAQKQFSSLLISIQRELGFSVVLATHTPKYWDAFATQYIKLNFVSKNASKIHDALSNEAAGLPDSVGGATSGEVGDGTNDQSVFSDRSRAPERDAIISLRNAYFRFDSKKPWVLRGLNLDIKQGLLHALIGGNASGKTTLLRIMARSLKLNRGKLKRADGLTQAYLPQNPKTLFLCKTAEEELREWQSQASYTTRELNEVAERFKLDGCLDLHPYDLSWGQQQMLALAKLLLLKPQLLLLDEPTKGLDQKARRELGHLLCEEIKRGTTIVVATHDLDFVSACAHEATLLFEGCEVCTEPIPDFFEDNIIWKPNIMGSAANNSAQSSM